MSLYLSLIIGFFLFLIPFAIDILLLPIVYKYVKSKLKQKNLNDSEPHLNQNLPSHTNPDHQTENPSMEIHGKNYK